MIIVRSFLCWDAQYTMVQYEYQGKRFWRCRRTGKL